MELAEAELLGHVRLLSGWVRMRFPEALRGALDPEDIVQDTLLTWLSRGNQLRSTAPEAARAFLIRTAANRIRSELRRAKVRTPSGVDLADIADSRLGPFATACAAETEARSSRAWGHLRPHERTLLSARLGGSSWSSIAASLDFPSADAARMAASRAGRHFRDLLRAS